MRKILTLCLIVRDNHILLGMKKRGFGMGRWNGFGGKVESGETIEKAARRETQEECGITIRTMEEAGIHEFEFHDKKGDILEVHVFRVNTFDGEPIETDEMRPRWFDIDALPYTEMWPDDIFWIPLFLEGKKFHTRFLFGEGDQILEQHIEEITQ